MKKLLCTLIFSTLSMVATAAPPTLTRAQAAADIDTAVWFIRTVHPSPFTVMPERKFDRAVARVKKHLPDTISNHNLFLQLAPLVHGLGDGHTSVWQGSSVSSTGEKQWFPAPLKVDIETLEMTLDGRHIAKINGIPARKIVNRGLTFSSGESKKLRANWLIDKWSQLVSMLYPAQEYKIKFADGKAITLRGTTKDVVDKMRPQRRDKLAYIYNIEGATAIMEFNEFWNLKRFEKFLEHMFTEIRDKNVDNLVIDLRKNGGGISTLGDELLQYISPVPFRQFGAMTVRLSKPMRDGMLAFMRTQLSAEEFDEAMREEGDSPMKDTLIVKSEEPELIPLRENPLRFGGKVWVLTSLNTFSSAACFVWAVQKFGFGTIVGSETGGHVVHFGEVISTTLPNSQLPMGVSCKKFYLWGAIDADHRPIYPDIEVPPAEALDYVLKLIKNQ